VGAVTVLALKRPRPVFPHEEGRAVLAGCVLAFPKTLDFEPAARVEAITDPMAACLPRRHDRARQHLFDRRCLGALAKSVECSGRRQLRAHPRGDLVGAVPALRLELEETHPRRLAALGISGLAVDADRQPRDSVEVAGAGIADRSLGVGDPGDQGRGTEAIGLRLVERVYPL